MKIVRIPGRLFMTIAVSVTFCVGSIILLVSSIEAESKMAVFVALSAVTSTIAKDYFSRSDRIDDKSEDA